MVSSGPSTLPPRLPMGRVRAAALGAMLIVLAVSLVQIMRADRICSALAGPPPGQKVHEFTYATDEAYMHLALARRMALVPPSSDQPWPGASALAESPSPAWTLLLAGIIRLTGGEAVPADPSVHPRIELLAPLIINLAMAGLVVMLVGHALRFDVRRSSGLFARLLVVAACMAIPLLVLTGTEHLAHAFVLLLAISVGVELIEREHVAAWRLLASMLWMALAVGLRYESLAVAAALVFWAWIRRRLHRAVMLALAGIGAAAGIGVYLGTHGQSWVPLPVSMRLADGFGPLAEWGPPAVDRVVANLREDLFPSALVLITAAMLWARREQQSSPDAEDRIRVGWLFVFLVVGVVQLLITPGGEHFRYTAYLVPIGAVAILRALASRPGAKWAPSGPVGLRYAVMAVFCLVPLVVAAVPAVRAGWFAPGACRKVFVVNRKMAAFVRSCVSEPVIAGNEAGVLRYETNAQVLDLSVLGARRDFAESASAARIILVAGRPGADLKTLRSWYPAGGWRLPEEGEGCQVTVYAGDQGLLNDVRHGLQAFEERLCPPGGEVWYETPSSAPGETPQSRPGDEVGDVA
ncbi:MAG TPA: hypothetical protein PKG54_12010 [Phycisphaerae bacterium]|nr:hypothetical protein [Phycisphaerae bacterium]HOB75235.1 hypothetical protein [Phycisphaerae bacterium]HOJ54716.1 hypothetical protein [Phycisphaerae bacterium]HOL25933.1 hypothetical protein [Phycisphaerae bacterium]HPP19494.1 hypothetical protein [Phycisphaerae bacterium]